MINKFSERYDAVVDHCGRAKTVVGVVQTSTFLSEADTFIEYAFERACAQVKEGMTTLNEWRIHKEQYIKLTETTIYDFEHFSRHDASHSITILETIVMVVGADRIVKLSRGDLWFLLEAAYSHDIGMALTGDELCELWKSEDFQKYLLNCLHSSEIGVKEAAEFYRQMDNLIRGRSQLDGVEGQKPFHFEDCWPARISNYVEWLITGYIRKNHGERNRTVRKRIITLKETSIPARLYEDVVLISGLHTEEFEKIFEKLPREVKGINEEWAHPQFAAAMLRLGDVLDVENNRFSIYALEHMLEIPPLSMVHYGKHKAIRTIQITPKEIELTAESDQIEVCRETSYWFELVNREVRNVIIYWNKIAPKQLRGCRLRPSNCTVYHMIRDGRRERKVEYRTDERRYFEIDKEKFRKLVEGLNIYNKIDFIREYIQNALDASKVQIWMDLKRHIYDEVLKKHDLKELTVYDIPRSVYDKYEVRLTIELNVPGEYEENVQSEREDQNYGQVCITIQDKGIGIEQECLDVISCIGAGWKKRSKYRDELGEMPRWLRPTGGFGIGMQSAFMVSERVEIRTQVQGGKDGRHITMQKQELGGVIESEECFTEERGTQMTIKVPISELLDWNEQLKTNKLAEKGIRFEKVYVKNGEEEFFSAHNIGQYMFDVVGEYLHKIIPDSILPVTIALKGYKNETLDSAFWNPFWWRGQRECQSKQKEIVEVRWEGNDYQVYSEGSKGICIWDKTKQIHVCMGWSKSNDRKVEKSMVCYKSIRMTEMTPLESPIYQGYFMLIDYMGLDAGRDLKLNRNEFTEEAKGRHQKYVEQYIKLFMHVLTLHRKEKETEKQFQLEYESDPDFVRSRIILSPREDWEELEKEVSVLCEGERKTDYVIDKKRLWKVEFADSSNEGIVKKEFSVCYGDGEDGAYIEVSLLEFMKDYQKLLSDEKGNVMFLLDGCSEPWERLNKEEASLLLPTLRLLISEMDEDRNVETLKEVKEYIAKLRVEGAYVCPELLNIIHEKEIFKEIRTWMDLGKTHSDGFTVVKRRKNLHVAVKDFYLRSYTNDGKSGRMVWKKSECPKEYSDLLVRGMPWLWGRAGEEAVLLSPIPEAFRNRMNTKYYYNMQSEQTTLGVKEFMAVLTEMEEFQFMVSYVADNSLNEMVKGNNEEIRKQYEAYAQKIWEAVFEQVKKDDKKVEW